MKNWKTTLTGAVIGAAYFTLTAIQNGVNVKDAILSGAFVLLGLFSKDFDKTGTNKL